MPTPCASLFLSAIAMTLIGMSSLAEERHDGLYWKDFYRARSDDRDRRPPPSRSVNSPSRGEANTLDRAKAGERDPGSTPSTSGSSQISGEANSFGSAIGQMIGNCVDQATELKKASFEVITRAIQPSDDQRDALENIRITATGAADVLAATCPKNIPEPLSEKLDTLSRLLDGIVASLTTLRPALVTFYSLLDDEQKARLVLSSFRDSQPKSDGDAVRAGSKHGFDDGVDSGQDAVCRQWVPALRSWPIKEIETAMALSDDQHAALYQVGAATYRAAGGLVTSCRVENRLTPVGRLDTQREKLQTLRHGMDAIRPVVADFEHLLNADQEKSFDTMVNASSDIRTLAP
jgi:hypothetical protein